MPDDLLTSAQVPGFTQFVAAPRTSLPVHFEAGNPPQFVREFVCGEYYGFITDKALSGVYRQQNNANARRYGYRPGKWPYVPLNGGIVKDLKHQVLEIYEALYQFTNPSGVRAYLPYTENSAYAMHRLSIALAPGAVVIAHLLGPDPTIYEHGFYIAIPHGNYAIELEIQGGQSLTWTDVERYWKELAPRMSAIGG